MSAIAYARSRKSLEEENRNYRRSSPTRRKKVLPLFVASTLDATLARPLSPGLQYAAEVATFDELSERHIWDLPPERRSLITQAQVDAIFRAKCEDQKCAYSFNRAQRFNELMFQKCQGEWCSLRQCGLGMVSLKAITEMLVNDQNITHLDLSGNTFGPEGGEYFGRLLQQNTTLVVLRLQSVNIGEGVVPMMQALEGNKYLTALDLSGIAGITRNTIWGDAAFSVARMLEKNEVLSSLNLAHCGLQRSSAAIARACIHHVALTKLDLSGNKVKDDGCKAIGELLSKGVCSLLSLSLEENQITCVGATILGDALRVQEAAASSSLAQLYLGFNSIGSHGLSSLAAAFKEHHSIQTVSLVKNKLCGMGVDEDGYRIPDSVEGLLALFSAVESSHSLAHLKLNDCGIKALPWNVVNALWKTTSLQRLDISENPFGDEGGELLADGVGKNRSLTYLDCTQCGMMESMSSLATALSVHKTLTHLRINQGSWDPRACGMIDALKQNHVVVSVDLGKDALDFLRGSLARNKQLRVHNATPQLIEKQKELAHEESELQQTQEFIVDEIKSREKAMEQLKTLREKQKVAAQQMKEELERLKAENDEGDKVQARLQMQCGAAEDDFNNKLRELDNERNRLHKKTENLATQKAELQNTIAKLVKQYAHLFPNYNNETQPTRQRDGGSTSSSADFEFQKLDMDLRVAQSDAADAKAQCESLKETLGELQQSIASLSSAGKGAPSPAPSPMKKK